MDGEGGGDGGEGGGCLTAAASTASGGDCAANGGGDGGGASADAGDAGSDGVGDGGGGSSCGSSRGGCPRDDGGPESRRALTAASTAALPLRDIDGDDGGGLVKSVDDDVRGGDSPSVGRYDMYGDVVDNLLWQHSDDGGGVSTSPLSPHALLLASPAVGPGEGDAVGGNSLSLPPPSLAYDPPCVGLADAPTDRGGINEPQAAAGGVGGMPSPPTGPVVATGAGGGNVGGTPARPHFSPPETPPLVELPNSAAAAHAHMMALLASQPLPGVTPPLPPPFPTTLFASSPGALAGGTPVADVPGVVAADPPSATLLSAGYGGCSDAPPALTPRCLSRSGVLSPLVRTNAAAPLPAGPEGDAAYAPRTGPPLFGNEQRRAPAAVASGRSVEGKMLSLGSEARGKSDMGAAAAAAVTSASVAAAGAATNRSPPGRPDGMDGLAPETAGLERSLLLSNLGTDGGGETPLGSRSRGARVAPLLGGRPPRLAVPAVEKRDGEPSEAGGSPASGGRGLAGVPKLAPTGGWLATASPSSSITPKCIQDVSFSGAQLAGSRLSVALTPPVHPYHVYYPSAAAGGTGEEAVYGMFGRGGSDGGQPEDKELLRGGRSQPLSPSAMDRPDGDTSSLTPLQQLQQQRQLQQQLVHYQRQQPYAQLPLPQPQLLLHAAAGDGWPYGTLASSSLPGAGRDYEVSLAHVSRSFSPLPLGTDGGGGGDGGGGVGGGGGGGGIGGSSCGLADGDSPLVGLGQPSACYAAGPAGVGTNAAGGVDADSALVMGSLAHSGAPAVSVGAPSSPLSGTNPLLYQYSAGSGDYGLSLLPVWDVADVAFCGRGGRIGPRRRVAGVAGPAPERRLRGRRPPATAAAAAHVVACWRGRRCRQRRRWRWRRQRQRWQQRSW